MCRHETMVQLSVKNIRYLQWMKYSTKSTVVKFLANLTLGVISTSVTYQRLYRYKILKFGKLSAPKKYEQIVSQVYHGYEGVQNFSVDIVVHRHNEEHDFRLRSLLQRIKDKELTLNRSESEF